MEKRIDALEKTISSSIRSSISQLPWRTFSVNSVAHHIAREVIATTRTNSVGREFAPDQFTLSIHPKETGELKGAQPTIQREVALDLQNALEESGLYLVREPHITLATDPTLKKGEVRVIAWHSSDPSEFEPAIDIEKVTPEGPAAVGPFLVIAGKRHFPLTKSVVNIGRLAENDLVLDDPHISRRHAQLQLHEGRYKILDLESTPGTRVNGRLIKEHWLYPGDVIKLARIQLIYGEDAGGPPDATPPYKPRRTPPTFQDQVTPLDLKVVRDDKTQTL
jgi:hypothetical protein